MRLFSAILLCASIAHAQPNGCERDAVARARELFERGVDALHAGHASEGRDLLRRSDDLCPTFAAEFNLAVAHRRTGEPTEAVRLLEALLSREDLSSDERERLSEQLDQARRETGAIEIVVSGAPSAEVTIDGVSRGQASETPLRVIVDPGAHIVSARAGTEATRRIEVARGATEQLDMRVEPETHVGGGEDLTWLWVTLGIAAIVAAGVITTVVVIDNQPGVVVDPITGIRETLTIARF
jgi:hypothetical protein